jgi:predicted AAA+ superfamily ATPase
MYQELIQKNSDYIRSIKSYRGFSSELSKLTTGLNNNWIVTLSGLRNTGRTSLALTMLQKTQKIDESFYYNAELDTLWIIKNKDDFIILFDLYVRVYGVPKIIVLQNMNNMVWIKGLILQLYKTKKYKILLIWNNIQIQGVTNIELYPLWMTQSHEKNIRWGLPVVRVIPENSYKDFLLTALRNDILVTDIIDAYNIKNVSLYSNILWFLSENIQYSSIREIHRNLKDHWIDISHLTLIDYLASASNTKLLSKCFRYDMKSKSEISSKVQYYFGDVWIRKSFTDTQNNFSQNLLYLELLSNWYAVHWWINGKFVFDFFTQKWDSSFCIQFESSLDKSEIRKTARKLAKIDSTASKFVIVESKESIEWMRKFEEQWVQIIELYEFVKIYLK